MRKSEEFEVIELGTTYQLPKFRVVDGEGIKRIIDIEHSLVPLAHLEYYDTITFVRGDKSDNNTIIPRVDGILHKQLLGLMIEDLQYKSQLVPSRESAIVITKLQEALFWLEERSRNREKRNVEGTYQK
jgi:hypothetical protein